MASRSRRAGLQANVYDAVAGRVTMDTVRLIDSDNLSVVEPLTQKPSSSSRPPRLRVTGTPALAPEEALFRPESAPERYAERDVYMAHERDRPVLPESDMLKALHLYSSHYYAALRRRSDVTSRGGIDENSMDETALIALGILLEEAGRDVLGRRGDLVFTEPQDDLDASSSSESDSLTGDAEHASDHDLTDEDAPGTDGGGHAHAARPESETPRARRPSAHSRLASSPSSRRRKRQKMDDVDLD
ncbi:hypothetical protein F5X68DRAFT_2872 [Plectosphaerella plurivora]|uniref:Uncharacterized protein n=1 Tax=Plectosphaerella plurivora TaxID=936078 RepID=A0A9P9AD69_9PEZI|nr:hypothetical protein F5X68DRAFT_2872 [Plectosphaerella plurivora]